MEVLNFKQDALRLLLAPALCACYFAVALWLLPIYLIRETNLYIGLVMIPYVCRIEKGLLSNRFLIPALIFVVLAITVPVRSTLFFALLFTVLLLVENFMGKISLVLFFVLVLISPVFKFLSDTLSFPLRLWLSDIVAYTMTFAGMHVKSSGNIIRLDGFDFYIDQACAGLNMLHISLLICLFIITFHQKRTNSSLHFLQLTGLLLITFLLNIISNYFRILTIVLFKIMPGTSLHDLAGIICLVIYVILPLIAMTGPFIKRFGKPLKVNTEIRTTPKKLFSIPGLIFKPGLTFKNQGLHLLLLALIIFLSSTLTKTKSFNYSNGNKIFLSGYHKTILDNSVLKFEHAGALIYMKPTPFYVPEHNPMICWTGSGYEFKFIKKEIIKGTEIYTGTLEKGKDKIYAAWWFDDGKMKTIDQFKWRWQGAISESRFYLVNVNAAKASDLKKITETLLPSPFAGNP